MVSAQTVKCVIDASDTFLAAALETSNRSEIQIHHLQDKKLATSFELDSEDKISTVAWTKPKVARVTKKRSAASTSVERNQDSVSHLIVALEQGDILIFSPFQNEIVQKISNDSKVISLFATTEDVFWAVDGTAQMKQFSIFGNKSTRTLTFAQDNSIKLIGHQTDSEEFYVSSSRLYLIKVPFEEKKAELVHKFSLPRGHTSSINSIVASKKISNILVTSRESDTTLHIYTKKQNTSTLEAIDTVVGLKFVQTAEDEFLIVFLTSGGLDIFKNVTQKSAQEENLPSRIKVNSKFKLQDVHANDNKLIVAYFDDMKAQYSVIDLSKTNVTIGDAPTTDSSPVKPPAQIVKSVESEDDEEEEDQEETEALEDNEFVVSTSDELYSVLVSAIEAQDDQKLIHICKSNNSDLNIKQTLLKNVTAEQSITLFNKLSLSISGAPTESINLSKWLKYILLVHGNNIIKTDDNVAVLKLLRSSLLESTKHLPNLVALQGRLQLLKSQLQLRSEMANLSIEETDDESEDEDEEEEKNLNHNGTSNGNGSFYVNGEGDDDVMVYEDEAQDENDDEDDE